MPATSQNPGPTGELTYGSHLALDEGLREWRSHHFKMVERTIGTKTGTGSSSGADYLRSTLFHPPFPDLWAVRAAL